MESPLPLLRKMSKLVQTTRALIGWIVALQSIAGCSPSSADRLRAQEAHKEGLFSPYEEFMKGLQKEELSREYEEFMKQHGPQPWESTGLDQSEKIQLRQNADRLNEQLKCHWVRQEYPLREKTVKIAFSTDFQGSEYEPHIVDSCGDADLDNEAFKAIDHLAGWVEFGGRRSHRYDFESTFSSHDVKTSFVGARIPCRFPDNP